MHACPTCGGPTKAHCDPADPTTSSPTCDLFDCSDPNCGTFGTNDGRRTAVRS